MQNITKGKLNAVQKWDNQHNQRMHIKKLENIRKTTSNRIDNKSPNYYNQKIQASSFRKKPNFEFDQFSENFNLLRRILNITNKRSAKVTKSLSIPNQSAKHNQRLKQNQQRILLENRILGHKILSISSDLSHDRFKEEYKEAQQRRKILNKKKLIKGEAGPFRRSVELPPLSIANRRVKLSQEYPSKRRNSVKNKSLDEESVE